MQKSIRINFYEWNSAYDPEGRKEEILPWADVFVNAYKWIKNK